MVNPRFNKLRMVTFFVPPPSFHIVYLLNKSFSITRFLIFFCSFLYPFQPCALKQKNVFLLHILAHHLAGNAGIDISSSRLPTYCISSICLFLQRGLFSNLLNADCFFGKQGNIFYRMGLRKHINRLYHFTMVSQIF